MKPAPIRISPARQAGMFDLVLPEWLTVTDAQLITTRATNHTLFGKLCPTAPCASYSIRRTIRYSPPPPARCSASLLYG